MARLRSSAAYRIAIANFAAFAVGLALLGTAVFGAMHIAFTHQLDGQVRDEAQTLADEYRTDGSSELQDSISQREAVRSTDRMIYGVFAADGRRLYGSMIAARPPPGLHDISFTDPAEGRDYGRAFAVDLSPNERLVVAVDRDWVERIDRTVEIIFGLAFLAACLLGSLGAGLLGGYLKRRLQSISTAAEAIIGGNVRLRMPVSPRRDEFDELAITLNRMLDRIEGLLDNLRQVSSDVAHDLRTPLARLRTQLEDGAVCVRPDEPAAAIIEHSIRQVDEVLSLFAAILRIAEVESGETRRFFARVDVSALTTELAESYAPAVCDGGRTLLWSVEPGLVVEGDRELLAQALANLIENAQLHTPAETIIRLTATRTAAQICIQVTDNGPGVPRSELGRITKRFARLDTSRQKEGYGLGLNLVDAVARLHRGRLILKDSAPGLVAIIELPRVTPAGRPNDPA
jgi:signal transduction histidine kinase